MHYMRSGKYFLYKIGISAIITVSYIVLIRKPDFFLENLKYAFYDFFPHFDLETK